MWERIADGEMPPESKPQPTDAEKAIIKQWVTAGASLKPNTDPSAPRAPQELAAKGTQILKDHCKQCHGDWEKVVFLFREDLEAIASWRRVY